MPSECGTYDSQGQVQIFRIVIGIDADGMLTEHTVEYEGFAPLDSEGNVTTSFPNSHHITP